MSEWKAESGLHVVVSRSFRISMKTLRDRQKINKIYSCISGLARDLQNWTSSSVKRICVGDSPLSVRAAMIDNKTRLLFEGLIDDERLGSVLFIHDVCDEKDYKLTIENIIQGALNGSELREIDQPSGEGIAGFRVLDWNTRVSSRFIPRQALLDPEKMEEIIRSDVKSNVLPTEEQNRLLAADRPLFIHGQAGSGKTTYLCQRLAQSVVSRQRIQKFGRSIFLSYNEKLVEQAEIDTKAILRNEYCVSDNLQGVEFEDFQSFLMHYVDPSRFKDDGRKVRYSTFKRFYDVYKRQGSVVGKIAPEVAWHGIRSILKGSCVPPSQPPLSREEYNNIGKRRRDFEPDVFDVIYRIGEWYQEEIIKGKGLWDDQDLAYAALDWVLKEKKRNPSMPTYDEIFCDEGQDLTEIEFRLLLALCRRPDPGSREGLPLVFAGDPLQTINPTGFRWSVCSSEVFKVDGRPVEFCELRNNYRSDRKIITFANRIQKVRSYYMRQDMVFQRAWDLGGDVPQIVFADTQDEISAIEQTLHDLPPASAVIVWPEDPDELSKLRQTERALSMVANFELYTVSSAKGLEFRTVVLYKLGSSPEAIRWKDCLDPELAHVEQISRNISEDEIPLLYFLNRLYVAITRARLYLIVVETTSGAEGFWTVWRDLMVPLQPRAQIRRTLESHPAFHTDPGEITMRKWGDILFEFASDRGDPQLYERAKGAYEKAGEIQKVKLCDAKIMKLDERWEEAGNLYCETLDFEMARDCFDRGELWEKAYSASTKLVGPENSRKMAMYRFKIDSIKDPEKASLELYRFAMAEGDLDTEYLEKVGDALSNAGKHKEAAEVFYRESRSSKNNKPALLKAAHSNFKAGFFAIAEKMYEEAGETRISQYRMSKAENLLLKEDFEGAAQLFFDNELFDRVVGIYESLQDTVKSPKIHLLELTGESYLRLEKPKEAELVYRNIRRQPGRRKDSTILQRIVECLEEQDKKSEAYDFCVENELYRTAADLAQELGRPRREVLSIRIQEAIAVSDFPLATQYAAEINDEKLIHKIAGLRNKYAGEFAKAASEFVDADEWIEALDALEKGQSDLKIIGNEVIALCYKILNRVADSERKPTRAEGPRILEKAEQIREADPAGWSIYISPRNMGRVFEKCANDTQKADYFKKFIDEEWAREGWLRAKSALQDYYFNRSQREPDRKAAAAFKAIAENIEGEIHNAESKWRSKTDHK